MEIQIPLVIFTLLLCLANGIMGFQGYLFITQKASKRFHVVSIVTTAIVLAVGGLAVFTHLRHWERIFNGFGHITSGITHELILIIVMVVALVGAFILLRKDDNDSKSSYKALGIAFIIIAVVGGFVTAHSYDMYARPAWNNAFLYLYYYSSELILGAAGVWLIASILKEPAFVRGFLSKATLITSIASAVICIAAMLFIANIQPTSIDGITFYTYDPTHPAIDPSSDLSAGISGSAASIFWFGAVILGCLLPLIAGVLGSRKQETSAGLALPISALLGALIGGSCYRVVLYVVGISSYVYFF